MYKNQFIKDDTAIEIIQQDKNSQFIEVILMTKPLEKWPISIAVIEMK